MNTKPVAHRAYVLGLLCALLPLAGPVCAADIEVERACDVHAAAMVAEMKAGSSTVLSASELALVRRTAFKSCLARADTTTAPAATPDSASTQSAVAASEDSKPDESLWGSFERLLKTPVERTPGHERLRRRSGTY